MFEELLKQVEGIIQKNIGGYKDQFQKELGTFSDSLKKEYESIKANTQSSIDRVLDRFEQKLNEKQNESREKILKDVKDTLWDEISKQILTHKNELDQLFDNLKQKHELFKKEVREKQQELIEKINKLEENKFEKDAFNEYIKKYIDNNIEDLRKQLIGSFFKKKK